MTNGGSQGSASAGTIGSLQAKRAKASSSRQTLSSRTACGVSTATTSWLVRRPASIWSSHSLPDRIFRRSRADLEAQERQIGLEPLGQLLGIGAAVAEEEADLFR